MIFSEKTEVIYNGMYGIIDFVCNNYVVIELNNLARNNKARLIVHHENYKDIEILKASCK